MAVDLIPDPHNITYIHVMVNITYIRVMVSILVVIIVLVAMDKQWGKLVGNDR